MRMHWPLHPKRGELARAVLASLVLRVGDDPVGLFTQGCRRPADSLPSGTVSSLAPWHCNCFWTDSSEGHHRVVHVPHARRYKGTTCFDR